MPTSGGTGGPGIGRVAVRADAIEGGRRHRVERDQKRDIDSSRDEPLGEQAGDRLPRAIVLRRRAPGDRREHGELHRPGPGSGYRRARTPTWRSASASHILLIATYRRISGSALTASIPSAVPAAARVIAVAYPRARIIFLLL